MGNRIVLVTARWEATSEHMVPLPEGLTDSEAQRQVEAYLKNYEQDCQTVLSDLELQGFVYHDAPRD